MERAPMSSLTMSMRWLPRRWIEASIAALVLLAAAGAARAQDISVPIDMAAPLRLPAPAEGVAIGNPTIAGVTVQSERLLFVTGRAYGTTNLVVIGPGGRTIFTGRITVTPDETGMVTVTRGLETQRLACSPVCRPRPDIGDSQQSFAAVDEQMTRRSTAASTQTSGR
jgi:Flp pilus assembly secretin CpaC